MSYLEYPLKCILESHSGQYVDDIKAKTNQKCEDITYITRKQKEFEKVYDISEEKRFVDLENPEFEYIAASPTKKSNFKPVQVWI